MTEGDHGGGVGGNWSEEGPLIERGTMGGGGVAVASSDDGGNEDKELLVEEEDVVEEEELLVECATTGDAGFLATGSLDGVVEENEAPADGR